MTAHTKVGHSHTRGTPYGGAQRMLMTISMATTTQDGCHIAHLVQTMDRIKTMDKIQATETADEQHISTASVARLEGLG